MSAVDAGAGGGAGLPAVVPRAPARWVIWGLRAAVVIYVLGLLVGSGWLMASGDDEPSEVALAASLLGGLVLGHAYVLGAGTMFWWAGQPRLTTAQGRRVTAHVQRGDRARIARAVRRSDAVPPPDLPAALSYARVQHALVPLAGALLLVAGPLLLAAIYDPPSGGWGWVWVGVLTTIMVVADAVLWWTLRARIAVSRWSDPPAPLEVPLARDPAYREVDWRRWARDTTRAQVAAVAAVVVLIAGTAACLLLRPDPDAAVACLVVAGVVVAVEFALLLAVWPAYRRHVHRPANAPRPRQVPLAARADLTRALRRGRPTDPRYRDVALTQARAAAIDSAVAPLLFGVLLGLPLALTSPLLMLPIPAWFYLGSIALSVTLSGLMLVLSRRHQHAVEALIARAGNEPIDPAAPATRHLRAVTVVQRSRPGDADPPGPSGTSP